MKTEILNLLLKRRAELIKLLFAVFLLAIGSGLIVNYFTLVFETSSYILLLSGIVLVTVVFIYLIINILGECHRHLNTSGIIVFKENNILSIDRYEFAEKLSETLKAVFIENEALLESWKEGFKKKKTIKATNPDHSEKPEIEENDKSEIQYYAIIRYDASDEKKEKTKKDELLEEAIEYVLIEQLSTHLSTYFNNYSNEDTMIKEYTRQDFPSILLQNRIINLLSTPFKDRAIFIKAKMDKPSKDGEVVSIMGMDGSRFSRFDLVLPKDSNVIRKAPGILLIKSKRLSLELIIKNKGFGAVMPHGFTYNYLGVNKEDISAYKVEFEINVHINPFFLFLNKGWNYYNWIDSFIIRFQEAISFESFVKKIDWDSTLTRIIVNNQRQKFAYIKEKDSKAKDDLKQKN